MSLNPRHEQPSEPPSPLNDFYPCSQLNLDGEGIVVSPPSQQQRAASPPSRTRTVTRTPQPDFWAPSEKKVPIHYPFVVPPTISLTADPAADPSVEHARLYPPLSYYRVLHLPTPQLDEVDADDGKVRGCCRNKHKVVSSVPCESETDTASNEYSSSSSSSLSSECSDDDCEELRARKKERKQRRRNRRRRRRRRRMMRRMRRIAKSRNLQSPKRQMPTSASLSSPSHSPVGSTLANTRLPVSHEQSRDINDLLATVHLSDTQHTVRDEHEKANTEAPVAINDDDDSEEVPYSALLPLPATSAPSNIVSASVLCSLSQGCDALASPVSRTRRQAVSAPAPAAQPSSLPPAGPSASAGPSKRTTVPSVSSQFPEKHRSQNPISAVRIDQLEPCVVYPSDGTLKSLRVMSLTRPEPDVRAGFKLSEMPRSMLRDKSPIVHVETVDNVGTDKPFICTLSSADVLSFSSVDASARTIDFHGYVDNIRDILDVSVNVHSYQASVLTRKGLRILHGLEHLNSTEAVVRSYDDNLQPVDPRYLYNQVQYLPHPCQLMLSSRNKVSVFDIRTANKLDKAINTADLNNIHSVSLVSHDDYQFFAYHNFFHVSYYDLRYPGEVILRHHYDEIGNRISNIYSKRVLLNGAYQDLMVLYAYRSNYVNVSHVCHMDAERKDILGIVPGRAARVVNPPVQDYTNLLRSNIVWGDEPLQLRPFVPVDIHEVPHIDDVSTGVEVLTSPGDKEREMHVDVVLWNVKHGLMSIPTLLKEERVEDLMTMCDGGESDQDSDSAMQSYVDMALNSRDDWVPEVSQMVRDVQLGKAYHTRRRDSKMLDTSVSIARARAASGGGRKHCTGSKLLGLTASLPYPILEKIQGAIMSSQWDEEVGMGDGRVQTLPRVKVNAQRDDDDEDAQTLSKDEERRDVMDELKESCGGMLLNEVGNYVRGKSGAFPTPERATMGSQLANNVGIVAERVRWHEDCLCTHEHGNRNFETSVATDDKGRLPDWVDWDVYYLDETADGEAQTQDKGSDGGGDDEGEDWEEDDDDEKREGAELKEVMKRMHDIFFNDSQKSSEPSG